MTYNKFSSLITTQDKRKAKAKEIHEETMKKHKTKIMEDAYNEDDDCLVNILD